MKEKPMPLWKICIYVIVIACACSIRFGDDEEFNITLPVSARTA
ncbi:hypothetical protein [Burkholderia stagnalis]|nr:hypothetical protein [Burkholderia stagnalis]